MNPIRNQNPVSTYDFTSARQPTAAASLPKPQNVLPGGAARYVDSFEMARATKQPATASVQRTAIVGPKVPAGYRVFTVDQARILNASPKQQAPGNTIDPMPGSADSLDKNKAHLPQVDLIVNGSFNIDNGPGTKREYAAGTVIRNGREDTGGLDKTLQRGAVAVLENGKMVVLRQQGSSKVEDIQAQAQKEFGSKVKDFMGGGALLIENGQKVSDDDLRNRQKFDQGDGGINAQQMRRADHTVVAQDKNGNTFVIVAENKTGAEIQDELFKAGFVKAVKFDGSSGFVAKNAAGNIDGRAQGTNVLGIAVKVAQ